MGSDGTLYQDSLTQVWHGERVFIKVEVFSLLRKEGIEISSYKLPRT